MTSEMKILALGFAALGTLIAAPIISKQIDNHRQAKLELEKAKLESTYPPEYWAAKAAEAEAHAKEEQARIESEERLKIDERNRIALKEQNIREFEKNAPAEYWEQKRVEEEEKTKRALNKQRYDAEREASEQHRRALESAAKAAERAIRRNIGYSTSFDLI